MQAIQHLHVASNKLCFSVMGEYFPNAGNLGVFCHYMHEYNFLKSLQQDLVEPSNNPDQKYFKLKQPVQFDSSNGIPETTYTHLYIRKPDPYRHHVGDVDFEMPSDMYHKLKERLLGGDVLEGVRIFPRVDLDMIELYHPDVDVLVYISCAEESKKAHINLGYSNL